MNEKNFENDYEINLKVNEEMIKDTSIKKMGIILKGHIELPQNYKFSQPKLSNKGKFITAIGRGEENDIIFIWLAKYLNKKRVLELKGISRIEAVDFCEDELEGNIFVVLYKDEPPAFFDFDKGEKISNCVKANPQSKKVLSYSFSVIKKQHFALATDTNFIVYNIRTGKITRQIKSSAPIKIIRGNIVAFIDTELVMKILDIKEGKEIKCLKLSLLGKISDILTTIISPDYNFICCLKKDGFYKIKIDNGEITEILKVEDIVNGSISDDCKIGMTTNMINVRFWNLENKEGEEPELGKILKEKFNSFSVNFAQSKFLASDDICIDLTDIKDKKSEQRFIWLDLNPEKFQSFSFSPDYRVLLAIIDEYSAITYNCSTGEVVKKWKIMIPNWYLTCTIVPETSKLGVIVTKSYDKVIKIWDYLTGTDLSTFSGFDANNFSFSKNGFLLGAGNTKGEEIARVWDLTNGNFSSFYYNKGENINTIVNLSRSEPQKVIAVSEKQNPVVFDYKTKNIIQEYEECPVQLKIIKDVRSNKGNKLFYVYGEDINNINTAFVFDFSTGKLITEFNNCRNIEFGKTSNYLLSDSDDINKGLLTITNLENVKEIKRIECDIPGVHSHFLADNKNIASLIDSEEINKKSFIITDFETGKKIAEIEYEKKTENYTETILSSNTKDHCLIFRFIELQNPNKK